MYRAPHTSRNLLGEQGPGETRSRCAGSVHCRGPILRGYSARMPVLGTKLHVPSPRRQLVGRPRLVDRLRTAPGAMPRLVLIAAPAGFGKTTVMTQWLAGRPSATEQAPLIAWLSLDSSDRDLREFLTHLLAALQAAGPDVGSDAKALLENDRGLPVDDILVSLINDLDVLAGPTVIAFDDYHAVDNVAVHEVMTFLLDHLPPQVSVALTTRADPPLPLARLRTRGELLEIRAADLRFTPEEAEAFLNEVMGLDLEPAYVAALETRTEGWAAGLQLAALSAQSHDSDGVGEFVDAFAGSHRFVLDYLVEEVLDSQPEDVRAFLLDTSVLDELTGSLCNALTGRDDGQHLLEALVRTNLFVVQLDDERRWYRYHHLFADALRALLAARHADRVGGLHAAASRWLAGNGLLADAVRHAIAGGDHEHTADLIELTLADLRRRRQDRTLRDWLVALPDDVVRRRPLLATYVGWRRRSEGDIGGVEAWVDAAEAGLDTTPPSTVPTAASPAEAVRDREAE